MKIILATHNSSKVKEISQLMSELDLEIVSLDDIGITEDVVEDGDTFAANALKKARFAADQVSEWVMADDSGMCIDALDGQPGIHSARWAGDDVSDRAKAEFTLVKMENVPVGERGASFNTVAALIAPDGSEHLFEGILRGEIMTELRGPIRPHLPYDCLFKPEGYDQTYAQMSPDEKCRISHRGIAFNKLKKYLREQTLNQNK
ncbi:RdgB/HAM1 family non-canonical purine NTP pyrophosphatase [Patescibacteria group bacterium]|nr:RdgB/HAM1 family non-canonical purine NTP pyrophosphatase [Patescibacteria group bacterium]